MATGTSGRVPVRMLIELPEGGALIDTPGLRELALWAGQDSVDDVFAGIAALARQCRFHPRWT